MYIRKRIKRFNTRWTKNNNTTYFVSAINAFVTIPAWSTGNTANVISFDVKIIHVHTWVLLLPRMLAISRDMCDRYYARSLDVILLMIRACQKKSREPTVQNVKGSNIILTQQPHRDESNSRTLDYPSPTNYNDYTGNFIVIHLFIECSKTYGFKS